MPEYDTICDLVQLHNPEALTAAPIAELHSASGSPLQVGALKLAPPPTATAPATANVNAAAVPPQPRAPGQQLDAATMKLFQQLLQFQRFNLNQHNQPTHQPTQPTQPNQPEIDYASMSSIDSFDALLNPDYTGNI